MENAKQAGIGTYIQRTRKRLKLSMAKVAKKAGLTRQTIWEIERGDINPRPATVEAISKAFYEVEHKGNLMVQYWSSRYKGKARQEMEQVLVRLLKNGHGSGLIAGVLALNPGITAKDLEYEFS